MHVYDELACACAYREGSDGVGLGYFFAFRNGKGKASIDFGNIHDRPQAGFGHFVLQFIPLSPQLAES